MNIVVVGAGIAGSCLAHQARERGHTVTVCDGKAAGAASRCALALTRTAWWPEQQRPAVVGALDWYRQRDWLAQESARVHDVLHGRIVDQDDHYLIDPLAPLVKPDIPGHVSAIGTTPGEAGVNVSIEDWGAVPADAVVVAAGSHSPAFPPAPAEAVLSYGGTWVADGNHLHDPAGPALRMLRLSNRCSYTAAYVGGQTRVGSSRNTTAKAAHTSARTILARMIEHGIVDSEAPWRYASGTRYTLPTAEHIRRLGPRVWLLAGFGRGGYITAPTAARTLLDRLELT